MNEQNLLLAFELPFPTPTLNEWQRMHFTARKRLKLHFAWLIAHALGQPWNRPPIQKCVVVIERHGSRIVDWDGLCGGFKPLLDAMVKRKRTNPCGTGLIEDDSPKVIQELVARQALSSRKGAKTVVRIYETNS